MDQSINKVIGDVVRSKGGTEQSPVKLGNVCFWVDATGPWAGQLSYDLPTLQWDCRAIVADVLAAQ